MERAKGMICMPWLQSILLCNHNQPWRGRTTWPHFSSRMCNWLCRSLLKLSLFILLVLPNVRNVYARDVRPQVEHYTPNYKYYHNISQIGIQLKQLAARNPNYIELDLQYKSRVGIPQYVLHLSNFSSTRTEPGLFSISMAKPKILLSYGEHAREFFPVESLFYLLNNITGGLSAPHGSPAESLSRLILGRVDLYIIAMANPDGRRHVERTKNYCWRGTSVGVDLNRNFDWSFGGKGSSGNPKDEEYRGPFVHSEPECQVYLDLSAHHNFDAFLSLHSGIKQIYLPFADAESKKAHAKPVHLDDQLDLAQRMAQVTQNAFSYGVAYNLNDYPADGTVFDYMAGVRKVTKVQNGLPELQQYVYCQPVPGYLQWGQDQDLALDNKLDSDAVLGRPPKNNKTNYASCFLTYPIWSKLLGKKKCLKVQKSLTGLSLYTTSIQLAESAFFKNAENLHTTTVPWTYFPTLKIRKFLLLPW